MPGWALIETDLSKGRTFQRPLDPTELVFFWEACLMNGTSDSLYHIQLRLVDPSWDDHIFSDANIVKTWLSTKRRHPLAGATVRLLQEDGDDSAVKPASVPYFVVQEHKLAVLRPQEIIFGQVTCAKEVRQRMDTICDNPRPLSNELLSQLYVFRETDSQVLHLMVVMAHYVTDGTANRSFMRCLLDTRARGGELGSALPQLPLEQRLAMKTLAKGNSSVIDASKMKKTSTQGGHTLPCRLTRATPHVPAQTGFISTTLTEAQTTAVIANCRLNSLTFGCAHLALAQVAMTRVLFRRYLRGEISQEEWEYRKIQPLHISGRVNLRSHLDKAWFDSGGGGELLASVGSLVYKLPFMTLGDTERRQYDEHDLSDGAPPFSDLLTFERFSYRVELVKGQLKAFLNHPLFLELISVSSLEVVRRIHHRAMEGTKHARDVSDDHLNKALAVTEMGSVNGYSGASLGNLNLIFPTEYPLPPSHQLSPFSSAPHPFRTGYVTPPSVEVNTTQKIVVDNAVSVPHVRPACIYLGALTTRGRMEMWINFDHNVFEEEVVKEWLDEVKGAVLWYLGQTHSSHREQSGDKS